MKPAVGIIGWRGLVGSVLMQRMHIERDFEQIDAVFFSSSQAGKPAPNCGQSNLSLKDAKSLDELVAMDIIISCQGSAYTQDMHPKLRAVGWSGHWVDAASALRAEKDSVLVLDPINGAAIDQAIECGMKDFIGANCTVSLLLLALSGLIKMDCIEWVQVSSYQAISGAGAQALSQYLDDVGVASHVIESLQQPDGGCQLSQSLFNANALLEAPMLHQSLIGNVWPWIDSLMPEGQTKEEWKATHESKKILGSHCFNVESQCVRVGSLRAHAQSVLVKLKPSKLMAISEVEAHLDQAHPWVHLIANEPEATLSHLTPQAVSNTLSVHVGRVRPSGLGEEYINLFTVGDQLLWGASEPLRRMLSKLIQVC